MQEGLQCYEDLDNTYSFGSPDTLDLREQFLPYRIRRGRNRIQLNQIARMWHRIFKDMLGTSAPALRMMEIVNEDDGSVDVEEQGATRENVGEGQVAVKEEKMDLD